MHAGCLELRLADFLPALGDGRQATARIGLVVAAIIAAALIVAPNACVEAVAVALAAATAFTPARDLEGCSILIAEIYLSPVTLNKVLALLVALTILAAGALALRAASTSIAQALAVQLQTQTPLASARSHKAVVRPRRRFTNLHTRRGVRRSWWSALGRFQVFLSRNALGFLHSAGLLKFDLHGGFE